MPRSKRRSVRRRPTSASITSTLTVLVIVAILLIFQALTPENQHQATATPLPAGGTATPSWYALYFTDPGAHTASSFLGGPDEFLAAAIDQARLSVDIAAYEFNLRSLRAALLAAQRRGVAVRLVTDSDNLEETEVQDLISAGIPVLGDRREGLMHNKFVVIDRLEVWTGSMNMTANDAYRNNNNLIRIRSTRLAQNYTAEFEEMYVDDRFGPSSPANTPHPSLSVEGTLLEVYFSPDDGTASRLLELVNGAQEQISFLAYSFTSDDLAGALLSRAQAGVTVSGVMESSQFRSNVGTEYERFRAAGLDVRLDGNPRNMHHKVLVIDGQIAVTGSYNFSANAEKRNDENTLVIHNPEIAAQFQAEFERIFAASQP
jgi:phosphatidylserine/phosphatidylglycerophosphate/cardiolipin synthase-like enzyme